MAEMKLKKRWPRYIRIAGALLFLALSVFAFSGYGPACARIFHVQFGPALMRCLAAFSFGALASALVIALVSILFGRFYCAVFCPLGILQDAAGSLSRRKGKTVPNCARTRYAVAGLTYGLLIGGWSAGFLLLDPYSNFGRAFGSFSAGALALPVIVILLAIWKKRLYCTTICPVGALLGLLAKKSVFRLAVRENCVKCGLCVKNCPSGCIDIDSGTLDNERCIRCLNCVSLCPRGSIGFVRTPLKREVAFDASRRAFLVRGGILLAGAASGFALARAGIGKWTAWAAARVRIFPPGAGDPARFAARCTACQLCTVNCPAKIIVPAPGGDGPVSLDLTRGACRIGCTRCSGVCPTGALLPLTPEEKRRTKIGQAVFDPEKCIGCGKCVEACPVKAVVPDDETGALKADPAKCIGCGACRSICPAEGKAIRIEGVEKQILLNG